MEKIGVIAVIVLVVITVGCLGPEPTVSPLPTPTMVSPLPVPGEGKISIPIQLRGGDEVFGFDFSGIAVAVAGGNILLLPVIIGLVQFLKEVTGLGGKWLRVASLALGVGLGLSYLVAMAMPRDFAGWFGAVIFGLALGMEASGVVDYSRDVASRAKGS